MTNPLLYTAQISLALPKITFSETVETMQVDSYTVRAQIGINPHKETYEVQWSNLTDAQATALKAQFQTAAGVSLIDWTPPLCSSSQVFTCISHGAQQYPSATVSRWVYNATLVRQYDHS